MATASSRPSLSPHHPPQFTPIEEGNEDEEFSQGRSSFRATSPSEVSATERRPHLTPAHQNSSDGKCKGGFSKKKEETREATGDGDYGRGVLCNKCRPNNREKISVVPVDNTGVHNSRQSLMSPNGMFFKSIFSTLVKKSPHKSSDNQPSPPPPATEEDRWKNLAAELSNKLVEASRKRDEAVLEASRLKYSMGELEKKLNKLEVYCHGLKSGLEFATNKSLIQSNNNKVPLNVNYHFVKASDQKKVIEHFLVSVSEARSSIRILSRALTLHTRKTSNKIYERLSLLLQPYDMEISPSSNPREMLVFMEALLNRAFHEEFESTSFQKSGPTQILNPIERCESNFASYKGLKGLTWGEVLTRGTKHFSEEFSKFCDRKMSEIVAMVGWNRAWPEQLLQSLFNASKSVWIVHLLAHSLHPSLPIFRVDKGILFDSIYMEDIAGGDKGKKLVPSNVRIMVTPGFFVFDNVVKCKVICKYQSDNGFIGNNDSNGQVLPPSPI